MEEAHHRATAARRVVVSRARESRLRIEWLNAFALGRNWCEPV